ncbi:Trypsin [Vibrio crassostreae]|uniref:trypsin-like peptidase domain-containing protein n=1 Tax=Vibrio crassostreae TaxID=246167 RepID=UPI0005E02F86|nr:trypsin-like peptidase domain-containing protein [Vibrio crassostreae]TCT60198.1 trypsin-like peptidase [Vibrio crassostreae]TCT81972.1 trypsin-like peptidase [Vibrio crassostreae]TCU02814.1 trypsin-like peptidase [Vibrio crassostreae]TDW09347.1 trypsin-like peptidase [Vibrio crassostreae]CAK1692622.1 Trypsin [Vibrio crassostreae]
MIDSVLKVSSTSNPNFGTCFAIKNDENGTYFVTCGHVINRCDENHILVDNNKATVLENKYCDGKDIALLFVNGIQVSPLRLGTPLDSGFHQVIGYTKLSEHQIKKEPIDNVTIKSNLKIQSIKHNNIIVDAIKIYTKEEIPSGYSGAPIICSQNKHVVGIVNLQAGKDTNYGLANIHIQEVCDISVVDGGLLKKRSIVTDLSPEQKYYATKKFNEDFEQSINCYATQNTSWIEPKLYSEKEGDQRHRNGHQPLTVDEVVASPHSLIIRAKQQYGLTSLAKYMIKKAWNSETSSFWLYLDVNFLKPHLKEINKYSDKILKSFGLCEDDIGCIVVDEVSVSVNNIQKILTILNERYSNIPMIIMMSEPDNPLISESIEYSELRDFECKHLWSLSRNEVREIVNNYNKSNQYIDSDNKVITRLTSDLEVLNIPRTPLNCLTFLKIYEYSFDESPVNRTDMISRVLFLLFNIDEIPNYKTKPDLKDVEYVLGFLCEKIIREHKFSFSRECFLNTVDGFCKEQEINMDTHVIFDVLFNNNIIIHRGVDFCFKFSYWILYFAAHRMHQDNDFYEYIFTDMNYTSYPEIIEYYAGVNRRSNNALERLKFDMINTRNCVESKCRIPEDFNIYDLMQWEPNSEDIDNVKEMLASGASDSMLPDEIKDSFADKGYDNTRPMKQSIEKILEDYSLARLMKNIQTSSKALRNSDYANTKLRHELLEEIIKSWEQVIKVLVLLSPALSNSKQVTVDGALFVLDDTFSGDIEDIFEQLIPIIPINVIDWFKNELFSKKMGTLFYNNAERHNSPLALYTLALLVASKRPEGWNTFIQNYISTLPKNSYYLCGIFQELSNEYQFSFSSPKELNQIADIIKLTMAKHSGIKNLNQKAIKAVSDKWLPERAQE